MGWFKSKEKKDEKIIAIRNIAKAEGKTITMYNTIMHYITPKEWLKNKSPFDVQMGSVSTLLATLKSFGPNNQKNPESKVEAYTVLEKISPNIAFRFSLEKDSIFNTDDFLKFEEYFYELELKDVDKIINHITESRTKMEIDLEEQIKQCEKVGSISHYIYHMNWKVENMYLGLDIIADLSKEILRKELIALQNNFHQFIRYKSPDIEKLINQQNTEVSKQKEKIDENEDFDSWINRRLKETKNK